MLVVATIRTQHMERQARPAPRRPARATPAAHDPRHGIRESMPQSRPPCTACTARRPHRRPAHEESPRPSRPAAQARRPAAALRRQVLPLLCGLGAELVRPARRLTSGGFPQCKVFVLRKARPTRLDEL